MTEQKEPSMEDILASIRNILAEDEEAPEAPEEKEERAVAPQKEKAPVLIREEQNEEDFEEVENIPVPLNPKKKQSKKAVPETFEEVASVSVEEIEEEIISDVSVEAEEEVFENDIVDLTEEMIVSDVEEEIELHDDEEGEFVPEPVVVEEAEEEEDDFVPEPVIVAEPVVEETLSDLMQESVAQHLNANFKGLVGGGFEEETLLAEPTVVAAAESFSQLRSFAGNNLSLGRGDLTIETIVRETLKPYLKEWLDANLPVIVERVVKKEVAHIMDRLDLK